MSNIKARLVVTSINAENEWFEAVGLVPMFSQDPADPNHTYSQSTPSGQVSLSITNRAAFGQFVLGDTYDIEFVKVDVTETATPALGLDTPPGGEPVPTEPATAIQGTATGFATPVDETPVSADSPLVTTQTPAATAEPVAVAPDAASVTDGTNVATPVAVAGPETPAPDAPAAV